MVSSCHVDSLIDTTPIAKCRKFHEKKSILASSLNLIRYEAPLFYQELTLTWIHNAP